MLYINYNKPIERDGSMEQVADASRRFFRMIEWFSCYFRNFSSQLLIIS